MIATKGTWAYKHVKHGVMNCIREFGFSKAIEYYQWVLDNNSFANNTGALELSLDKLELANRLINYYMKI